MSLIEVKRGFGIDWVGSGSDEVDGLVGFEGLAVGLSDWCCFGFS